MKNFHPSDHVNYVHLAGEILSIDFRQRNKPSSYCIILLEVATQFRGKQHDPIKVKLVFWDTLAEALDATAEIGDIINVEGRLTIRSKNEGIEYTVTGNKVKVCRRIPGKEPFLQEIEKEVYEDD